ncbi:MAG: MBG domain-containing protein [Paludibacter sp.]
MKNTEKKNKNKTNFNSPFWGLVGISPLGVRGLFCLLILSLSSFAQTSQTITFPDIPVKGYGDTSYALNATSSSGLAVTYVSSNTTVATVSGSTVTIKTTGYSVISAYQAGNATYAAATPVPQLLVVCPKATLTVTADNKTITAGSATPSLTYTVAGYKKSETSSVITGTPVIQSPGSNLSTGTYPIVINQGTITATNYEFMLVDGTLTVSPVTSTPSVNNGNATFKVYPNPASDFIVLECAENAAISIYDLIGNLVLNSKLAGNSVKLDVSKLPVGSYYIVINRNNTLISNKLLINR